MNLEAVSTEAILAERLKTHGEFSEHAQCTIQLTRILRSHRNWPTLSPSQLEAIHMICHKLARIAVGNPDLNDHWDDIAGYAKLVSQRLPGVAESSE